jgi:Uma2 family endonuclease
MAVLSQNRDETLLFGSETDEEIFTFEHSLLQTQLLLLLEGSLQQGWKALLRVTFQGTNNFYTPDVVVYPKRDRTSHGTSNHEPFERVPPVLAVEVLNPQESNAGTLLKCVEMLESGVEECWIVEPSNETVTVCRNDTRFVLHRGEVLEYSLCTRTISVDEIFDV